MEGPPQEQSRMERVNRIIRIVWAVVAVAILIAVAVAIMIRGTGY